MKLTCRTSPSTLSCRFDETNSLRAWTDYSVTVVSEKFRDDTHANATLSLSKILPDATEQRATCVLTPDPLAIERNKRFGTLLLNDTKFDKDFTDALAASPGVGKLLLENMKFVVRFGTANDVIISTEVPVVLCAK